MTIRSFPHHDGPVQDRLPARTCHALHVTGLLIGFVATSLVLTPTIHADDSFDFLPGLVAKLVTTSGEHVDRVDREVRIDSASLAGDPRLVGKLKTAEWTGYVMSQNPGRYRLAAYAAGKVILKVAGSSVLDANTEQPGWLFTDPMELEFDWHPLEVHYEPADGDAELALYWSGPGFAWEPLGPRQLYHDPEATISDSFRRGAILARALRCQACHQGAAADRNSAANSREAAKVAQADILPAPSLGQLAGNLHSTWLADWLGAAPQERQPDAASTNVETQSGDDHAAVLSDGALSDGDDESAASNLLDAAHSGHRRMPYFALSHHERDALAQFLLEARPGEPDDADSQSRRRSENAGRNDSDASEDAQALRIEQGETLVLSLGCLACHHYDSFGHLGLFGGGDLTWIAEKRPADFFARWLTAPQELNPHHRMPVYELDDDHLQALSTFLATRKRRDSVPEPIPAEPVAQAEVALGKQVFAKYRCAACHEGPGHEREPISSSSVAALTAQSNWNRGCSNADVPASAAPSYALTRDDQEALRIYYSSLSRVDPNSRTTQQPKIAAQPSIAEHGPGVVSLDQRLLENNCTACHGRDESDGLATQLTRLAEQLPQFAEQLPAMSPPSLNSVGDKLRDDTLREVIAGRAPVHRPWLHVRMPRYRFSEEELRQLTEGLVRADRIPEGLPLSRLESPRESSPEPQIDAREIAPHIGARLVTADGFGCLSCHAVGRVRPPQGPLNTLGPNLAMLENRIRRPWFDRWVRNPARIIPRMEMPSVQTAVPGVLDDNLDAQLTAVWTTLNEPNFRPPTPDPVRTLRQSGLAEEGEARAVYVTEVTKVDETTYIKPLVMGLPNRHNLLLDLEENRLAHWWLGDTARQRTLGKTWFWEPGSPDVASLGTRPAEWQLQLEGETLAPARQGQFLDGVRRTAACGRRYRIAASAALCSRGPDDRPAGCAEVSRDSRSAALDTRTARGGTSGRRPIASSSGGLRRSESSERVSRSHPGD
jgi:mono/diheme cytochrome c family protein